eukprot:c20463_g1_i1 orf=168-485(+)
MVGAGASWDPFHTHLCSQHILKKSMKGASKLKLAAPMAQAQKSMHAKRRSAGTLQCKGETDVMRTCTTPSDLCPVKCTTRIRASRTCHRIPAGDWNQRAAGWLWR